MKRFALCLLSSFVFLHETTTLASANQAGFVTPRDMLTASLSNISLHNASNANTTAYGIYVRQYAYVTPGQDCGSATKIYPTNDPATNNITAGAVVSPVTINAGQSAAIGANYLYNMIYQAIYYENIIITSSPPGCALPGCTWGSDNTKYNWCIYLGALAPVSGTTNYTSTIPPSANSASSAGQYNYNLVTDYSYLGPISCNDQTLTCAVSNQQSQSFG